MRQLLLMSDAERVGHKLKFATQTAEAERQPNKPLTNQTMFQDCRLWIWVSYLRPFFANYTFGLCPEPSGGINNNSNIIGSIATAVITDVWPLVLSMMSVELFLQPESLHSLSKSE